MSVITKMTNPTVSFIIPTYKHRDFVLATLDSVFAQTFTDYAFKRVTASKFAVSNRE